MNASVEFRSIGPGDAESLGRFFEAIRPDETFFHPHPLTDETARALCCLATKDDYVIAIGSADREVVAYGMLRGWDEGYEIPSLGMAVHPATRGLGLGRRMMDYLHELAVARDAPSVRLKVYVDNTRAVSLYRSLGYVFEPFAEGELLGILDLSSHQRL